MRISLYFVVLAAALGLSACDRTSDDRIAPAPANQPPPASTSEAPRDSNAVVVLQDTAITAKVKAALATTDELKDSAISVETVDGRVILSGKLPDETQLNKAVTVARAVEGVRDVESRIAVGKS